MIIETARFLQGNKFEYDEFMTSSTKDEIYGRNANQEALFDMVV